MTTAQASRTHLEGDYLKIELELKQLSDKLAKTVKDKMELEEQLRTAKSMVQYLQVRRWGYARTFKSVPFQSPFREGVLFLLGLLWDV